jgi:hypothetical protein
MTNETNETNEPKTLLDAVCSDRHDTVRRLVEGKADLNNTDFASQTAAFFIDFGRSDGQMVDLLYELGADFLVRDRALNTVLYQLARDYWYEKDREFFDLLLFENNLNAFIRCGISTLLGSRNLVGNRPQGIAPELFQRVVETHGRPFEYKLVRRSYEDPNDPNET